MTQETVNGGKGIQTLCSKHKRIPGIKLKLSGFIILLCSLLPLKTYQNSPPGQEVESEKSVREKYLDYQKKVTFTLPGYDPANDLNIGLGWYVDYRPRNDQSGRFDPFLKIAAVTSGGVYFRPIETTWKNLKDINRLETQMLVNTSHLNRITASHMVNNESILTVGYQNLTIEVYDLEKTIGSTPHMVSSFDLSHVLAEDEDKIRSIILVPYTNQLIVSGNRFSLFKLDRLRGTVTKKVKNPLDHIRHLCAPVPTDTPNKDPQNPLRVRPNLTSTAVHEMSETTYFLGTGEFGWMNFIMDWTTMKVIRYWSIERSQGGLNSDRNFIINRIAYYGGAPEAQLYFYSKSYYSYNLNMFSTIHQQIVGYSRLTHRALDNRMKWVNCTTFLYIIQKQIDGRGDREIKSYFINVGPYSFSSREDITDYHNNEYVWEKLTMVTFEMELGKKNEVDSVGPFDKLDRLYLSMYFDMSVVILKVPLFNWDFCNDDYFRPLLTDSRMLYGRYRSCRSCQNGLVSQSSSSFAQNASGTLFASKCFPKYCPEGQVYQYNRWASSSKRAICVNRYELTEDQKGVTNDNGCQPQFNMDPLGICRKCYKIDVDRGSLTPSDCVLFWTSYMDYD